MTTKNWKGIEAPSTTKDNPTWDLTFRSFPDASHMWVDRGARRACCCQPEGRTSSRRTLCPAPVSNTHGVWCKGWSDDKRRAAETTNSRLRKTSKVPLNAQGPVRPRRRGGFAAGLVNNLGTQFAAGPAHGLAHTGGSESFPPPTKRSPSQACPDRSPTVSQGPHLAFPLLPTCRCRQRGPGPWRSGSVGCRSA